jgi:hypothetical protein
LKIFIAVLTPTEGVLTSHAAKRAVQVVTAGMKRPMNNMNWITW